MRRFLLGRTVIKGRRCFARAGQTLVEYALILALISLVAISVLDEVGYRVKGSIATANCAMIWAQHQVAAGNTTEINAAWNEINTMLNNSFDSSKSGEVKMKNKIIVTQTNIKNKFLGTSN